MKAEWLRNGLCPGGWGATVTKVAAWHVLAVLWEARVTSELRETSNPTMHGKR